MNLIRQLEILRTEEINETLVKRYLLNCCVKLLRYRSGECLPKNLNVAKKFLWGQATKKQMHQAEWEVEGQAFGTEYFSDNEASMYFRINRNVRLDLVKVQIFKGFNNVEARKYLIEMAYFIDSVFCHIEYSSNWFFKESDEKFLCPTLFKRSFGESE